MRHRVILPLVMAILGFLTIPWLGPKHTESRATSVPKVKLGHTEPRATSVPKAKLGHTEPCATSVPKAKLGHIEPHVLSGYLTPSNGYIGFPYCPLVRPKTHGTACDISPKGEARTHGTACAIGLKGKVRTIHQCSYITPGGSAALGWIMLILFGEAFVKKLTAKKAERHYLSYRYHSIG